MSKYTKIDYDLFVLKEELDKCRQRSWFYTVANVGHIDEFGNSIDDTELKKIENQKKLLEIKSKISQIFTDHPRLKHAL
ncbi:MAG: hypothetical protein ACPGVT_10565 [Maricaulaceae bacterium]